MIVLVFAVLLGLAMPAPPETILSVGPPLARFDDARALSVDPGGRLYVADAGADVVVRLTPNGAGFKAERLGGPGSEEGQFYEPADVDPTNGLVVLVADAGNSRIQRFSQEFAHIETLPVGRGYDAAGSEPARPVYDTAADDAPALGAGRPVSVVSVKADETYALDVDEGVVWRWDGGRRAERIIGGFGRTDGRLIDPVALTADAGGLLYVADAEAGTVQVYDTFGRFVRTAAREVGRDVQSVAVRGGRLWVVEADRLLVFNGETGRRLRVLSAPAGHSLVDVAFSGDGQSIYALTPTALRRAAL